MSDELQDDPLAKLWDTSSVQDQRQLLAETIFPYARVDGETQEIGFTAEGEALTNREKLLVFLLMRKAMLIREVISKEAISPGEIEKATGISGGSIRPVLSQLVADKLVRKDKGDDGGYYVPASRIKEINAMLAKKGGKS